MKLFILHLVLIAQNNVPEPEDDNLVDSMEIDDHDDEVTDTVETGMTQNLDDIDQQLLHQPGVFSYHLPFFRNLLFKLCMLTVHVHCPL